MNIDEIEKIIGHEQMLEDGWRQTGVNIGFFQRYKCRVEVPVLIYKKKRYLHVKGVSVDAGYYVSYYNEFGFICTEVQ